MHSIFVHTGPFYIKNHSFCVLSMLLYKHLPNYDIFEMSTVYHAHAYAFNIIISVFFHCTYIITPLNNTQEFVKTSDSGVIDLDGFNAIMDALGFVR